MIKFWLAMYSIMASCLTQDMAILTDLASRNGSSVKFLFFKSSGRGEPHAVKEPKSLNSEDFDPRRKTIIIIHGFSDYYPGSILIPALVQAYSSRGIKNLIAVEWGELAAAPFYVTAARNSYIVGQRVAYFLSAMIAEKNLSMKNTEIIGFSLGAHVAGVASSQLDNKPRRIIGLDPAELLFSDSPKEFILDKSDAPLVEVIHTSGGYVGFKRPLGHRDFYPNGGTHPQPGCIGDLAVTCSHRRAYFYFAEAIKNNGYGFMATKCTSIENYLNGKCSGNIKLPMANRNFNLALNGSFFLTTNSNKPFGRKQ